MENFFFGFIILKRGNNYIDSQESLCSNKIKTILYSADDGAGKTTIASIIVRAPFFIWNRVAFATSRVWRRKEDCFGSFTLCLGINICDCF